MYFYITHILKRHQIKENLVILINFYSFLIYDGLPQVVQSITPCGNGYPNASRRST
jgi:hypothetical protein